jgi:hypothetical protein
MKLGRNQKCWCGSNKKFKHYHYGRERETPISKGELIGHSKKSGEGSIVQYLKNLLMNAVKI